MTEIVGDLARTLEYVDALVQEEQSIHRLSGPGAHHGAPLHWSESRLQAAAVE